MTFIALISPTVINGAGALGNMIEYCGADDAGGGGAGASGLSILLGCSIACEDEIILVRRSSSIFAWPAVCV